MSSRNGSGGHSNGKRCISTNTIRPGKPENESGTGSTFTTRKDPINHWITELIGRYLQKKEYIRAKSICINLNKFFQLDVLRKDPKIVLTNPSTLFTHVAELGDLFRLKTVPQFMAYLESVPLEASSGKTVRRSGITKTGNGHVIVLMIDLFSQFLDCLNGTSF